MDLFPCYPSCQKIFEKLMCARLDSYLKSNNILCANQFGFRKNSNTSKAIIEFRDYVYSSFDKTRSTIAVYLDFSKAFDTVNHEILKSKLQHNGIRGVMLSWFKSYLSNRKQYLSQKLQLLYAKHYIRCSSRLSVGPSTFSVVHQRHA